MSGHTPGPQLDSANMQRAKLQGANLAGASVDLCDMRDADTRGASLFAVRGKAVTNAG